MGNEMGNNITAAIKEEDNISEAEKKNPAEDATEPELANGTSQDVHADSVKEENQNVPTSKAKDVMDNDSNASSETRTELGKDAMQEDDLADDAKGTVQTSPTAEAEAEDAEEKARWFASNSTTSMLEHDPLEGVTHASDVNMHNQILPTAEAEDVQVKVTELASKHTTDDLGNVTLQEESYADDVKEEIQMIPTSEANDVQEKSTGLICENTESMLENDSLEGVADESEMNMQTQMHPPAEAEDGQEKTAGIAFDCTRSSLQNDLSKGDIHEDDVDVDCRYHQRDEGKDDQGIAPGLDNDEKISEPEEKLPQEDKQDGNVVICIANGTDAQGKTIILASDDKTRLNLRNSFGGEGEEMTEARQPEILAVEEKTTENQDSSLEGTEKYGNQEDSCLRKNLSETYNHHLDEESSIKQAYEEETSILTFNAVNTENSELQESPSEHSDRDEPVRFLSEGSLHRTESLLNDNLPDANHFQQIKDDVPEKDMGCKEKLLYFGNGLIYNSETTSDSLSIGNNSNGNLLAKVNYTTEGSLNSFPESFIVDNPLKPDDQEESCKVFYEESKLSKSGSTRENPQDNYKLDQSIKDSLQENKSDMVNTNDITTGSNEDCNGERHLVLDSSVFLIGTNDQVEEPEVTENGLQCDADAHVNNFNKASYESIAAPEEKHSLVPEAEAVFVIAGSTFSDCKHDKREIHQNKTADTNEKPEASLANIKTFVETEMLEKSNSDLVTTILEESTISMEPCSNNSLLVHGGYETRDSLTRLSTESNPDSPNISCRMQKSPSFNLNLPEDSDQTPLLNQDISENESNSMSHAKYDQSMLHSVEMPVEDKIVTVERSYSKKSKAPFKGLLREKEEEEEVHLLVMPQTQDNHAGTKKEEKEDSSTSPQGKEKRKPRSSFFSSFMCCATVAN